MYVNIAAGQTYEVIYAHYRVSTDRQGASSLGLEGCKYKVPISLGSAFWSAHIRLAQIICFYFSTANWLVLARFEISIVSYRKILDLYTVKLVYRDVQRYGFVDWQPNRDRR